MKRMKCINCGAVRDVTDNIVVSICSYCQTKMITIEEAKKIFYKNKYGEQK